MRVVRADKGGNVFAQQVFGLAKPEDEHEPDPNEAIFLVASLSKQVTAWGIMKLVESGKISLDTPALSYLKTWRFPGSSTFAEKVTIRHLLSHTAGIDDGLGYKGFDSPDSVQTLDESLTNAHDVSYGPRRGAIVTREPGTDFAYSGASYTILQLVVEDVTQRRFADYMRDSVLIPLGMRNSTFDILEILKTRPEALATSYDQQVNPAQPRYYTAQASVSLHTTANDLATFAQAYLGKNDVLQPTTVAKMLEPQPGTANTWGLGHTLYYS